MTDKQIIIDGTQCRYASFDGGNTQRLLCAIDDCFCDGLRTNECYYKQLKRKEQECEELKKINKANAKSYEKHWYKLEKYKKTLAEIKEIAQFACEKSVCDRNHCDYCSDGQILQKISEVFD